MGVAGAPIIGLHWAKAGRPHEWALARPGRQTRLNARGVDHRGPGELSVEDILHQLGVEIRDTYNMCINKKRACSLNRNLLGQRCTVLGDTSLHTTLKNVGVAGGRRDTTMVGSRWSAHSTGVQFAQRQASENFFQHSAGQWVAHRTGPSGGQFYYSACGRCSFVSCRFHPDRKIKEQRVGTPMGMFIVLSQQVMVVRVAGVAKMSAKVDDFPVPA